MIRPKYSAAIEWIAQNDSAGDDDPLDILSGLISVLLVSDLFGVDPMRVATDVYSLRHPEQRQSTTKKRRPLQ